jgi:hypothetical protein
MLEVSGTDTTGQSACPNFPASPAQSNERPVNKTITLFSLVAARGWALAPGGVAPGCLSRCP